MMQMGASTNDSNGSVASRVAVIVLRALALALAIALPASESIESQRRPAFLADPTEPAPIPAGRAPGPGEYPAAFDALHYDINLTLPNQGSVIAGSTAIDIAVTADAPDTLALDFTGLLVTRLRVNEVAASFVRDAGKLLVTVPRAAHGNRMRVAVDYRWTPDDGLVIRDNVQGQRAAFADNWPNRARFWFPSLDFPADKATALFTIVAPSGWEVVANGTPDGRPTTVRLPDGTTGQRFKWRIVEPISTYNMVIGAADFRVQNVGRPCFSTGRCIDVTTWLFPGSVAKAAPSFRRAAAMVEYFSQLVAPFPYDKLAHVQSSTRYGGMENATAIFYDERALADGRNIELTVAHETAHQWFGDAVTEPEWPHVWLSEGFATYFAALFIEHADGVEAFRQIMEAERRRIVAPTRAASPVVNPSEQDLFKLLNVDTYDKGSWVLHMLRGRLGDDRFFDGIRRYYRAHEHGTGITGDLQRAMEAASGINLAGFFDQWLFRPGFPRFRVASVWDANQRTATVTVEQIQPADWPTFSTSLTLELTTAGGTTRKSVDVHERIERYNLQLDSEPIRIAIDPDGWVLQETVAASR